MAIDVSPEIVKALAPTGTLRAALNYGNTVLVQRGDNGGEPPKGVVEKVVHKGVEPKANTIIDFTGACTYTPETRFALRAMLELFEIKLTESLREQLGGVYSPRAGGGCSGGQLPHVARGGLLPCNGPLMCSAAPEQAADSEREVIARWTATRWARRGRSPCTWPRGSTAGSTLPAWS